MSDVRFFGLAAGLGAAIILVALVWPQGEGARSPKPFGHATAADRAAYKKAHTPPPAPGSQAPKPVF